MLKTSTFYLIIGLTLLSLLIVGILLGCQDKKHIQTPVTGPAAGSGPTGGGGSQEISLSANPSTTVTTTSDTEQATVKITAIVKNTIGQPMPDGTVVYWTATVGSLDNPTSTSSNGAATVTLTFPQQEIGCSTVTATSGNVSGEIEVCVDYTAPTATPEPTTTPSKTFMVVTDKASVANKGTATITATALTNGTPDQGLQVTFSVSGAGTLSASGGATNASGQVSVTFTGNNSSSPTQSTATVTGTTADGRSGTVTIIVN